MPVGRPEDKEFEFPCLVNGAQTTGIGRADGTTIELMAGGLHLEIPVEGFGNLASTLMIAAHSR